MGHYFLAYQIILFQLLYLRERERERERSTLSLCLAIVDTLNPLVLYHDTLAHLSHPHPRPCLHLCGLQIDEIGIAIISPST